MAVEKHNYRVDGENESRSSLAFPFWETFKTDGSDRKKRLTGRAVCCKEQVIFNSQPYLTKIKSNKVLRSSLALPASLSKDSFN